MFYLNRCTEAPVSLVSLTTSSQQRKTHFLLSFTWGGTVYGPAPAASSHEMAVQLLWLFSRPLRYSYSAYSVFRAVHSNPLLSVPKLLSLLSLSGAAQRDTSVVLQKGAAITKAGLLSKGVHPSQAGTSLSMGKCRGRGQDRRRQQGRAR